MFYRSLGKLIIIISIVILIISYGLTAFAYNLHNGYWENVSGLKYWKDSSVSQYGYHNRVDNAVSSWNGTPTQVYITNTSTEAQAHIKIYAGDNGDDGARGWALNYIWLGQVVPSWNGMWVKSVISLNDYYLQNDSTAQRTQNTAAHELGHSLGLMHEDSSGSTVLMYSTIDNYDQNNIYTPEQDDIDGVNAKYP